jgi:hypothetical protein
MLVFCVGSDLFLTLYILKIMIQVHDTLLTGHQGLSKNPNLIGNLRKEKRYRELVAWITAAVFGMLACSMVGIATYAISRTRLSTIHFLDWRGPFNRTTSYF